MLGAGQLLDLWEAGLNQPPLQRALILLTAATPGTGPDTLAALAVGQRDQGLLRLREALFGPRLQNMAICPQCGGRVEWESRTTDFLAAPGQAGAAGETFELEYGDYSLRFRLPTSLDVAAVLDHAGSGRAERLLLSRCVLEALHAGAECGFDDLPDEITRELGGRLESLDPLADLRIGLRCPECSHDWAVVFDIASFLWKEVDDWAGHLLRTISRLAAAYGWSEREILDISPVRRQLYLGMLGS